MPIYEYLCENCGARQERFRKVSEYNNSVFCIHCGNKCKKLISKMNMKIFEPQVVGATITDESGNDINQFVRNKSELVDAINRYNDTSRASKTGKVALYE
jgi:putative FmdB family regulatory protein